MFEVELQLGETDPSHIIRTIEYWDNQKRRWPSRSHTAVLVAERITSRFFNVVHLLSKAVPIVGIQANIVQVGETKLGGWPLCFWDWTAGCRLCRARAFLDSSLRPGQHDGCIAPACGVCAGLAGSLRKVLFAQ
jgi:hypothetical protein